MSDQDIITAAYQDTVKDLFGKVFWLAYTGASNDADRNQAVQAFKTGLNTARKARDAALAVV